MVSNQKTIANHDPADTAPVTGLFATYHKVSICAELTAPYYRGSRVNRKCWPHCIQTGYSSHGSLEFSWAQTPHTDPCSWLCFITTLRPSTINTTRLKSSNSWNPQVDRSGRNMSTFITDCTEKYQMDAIKWAADILFTLPYINLAHEDPNATQDRVSTFRQWYDKYQIFKKKIPLMQMNQLGCT